MQVSGTFLVPGKFFESRASRHFGCKMTFSRIYSVLGV